MAKVYIREYEALARDASGHVVHAGEEPGLDQVVAIGGTSAQSAAFGARTRFVEVHADAICSVAFGLDPTATVNSLRWAAGQSKIVGVRPGDKLAVISNT